MKYRWLLEYILIFLVSIYASFLWFKPVMWDLAWDAHTQEDVIKSIFFTTSEREHFWVMCRFGQEQILIELDKF